jgi:hypothetical protein
MPDVTDALEQIAEIHGHLAKSEVYRGWRPVPVAASGVIGLAAATYQTAGNTSIEPLSFVWFWSIVAAIALAVGCAEILWHYVRLATPADRRRSRRVLGQFLPALLAGAFITLALVRLDPATVALLPGLWSVLFGVGVFAARPYLPMASRAVAAFYWVAGLTLLWTCRDTSALSPWMVGVPFGVGQLLSAGALYWSLERRNGDHHGLSQT